MRIRIYYIDFLKLLAIFIVIWGHSIQYMSSDVFWGNPMCEFIYSFHMPLFMVLSGFFFYSSLKLNRIEFIKRKSRQLILPLFAWSIALELVSLIYNLYVGKPINNHEIYNSLSLNLGESLWFLKSLFCCYVVAYSAIKVLKIDWLACVASILFFMIFPNLFHMRFMLPFFWLGIFIKKYFFVLEKHNKPILIVSFFLFVISQLFWKGEYMIYFCKIPAIFEFKADTYNFSMSIALFRFCIGATGSVFFLLFIRYVYLHAKIYFDKISVYGGYTLGIYIIQAYFFGLSSNYIILPKMNILFYNFIITPFVSIVLLIICILGVKLIEKNKITSFLFLGNEFNKK